MRDGAHLWEEHGLCVIPEHIPGLQRCSHPLKMPSLAATGKEIFPSWHEQGSACSGASAHMLLFLQEKGVWNTGTGMGGGAASIPQGC